MPQITNKEECSFAAANIAQYGDKVDMETRDTVKRFLDKMKRNIDNYQLQKQHRKTTTESVRTLIHFYAVIASK